jgi:hypothetical protein
MARSLLMFRSRFGAIRTNNSPSRACSSSFLLSLTFLNKFEIRCRTGLARNLSSELETGQAGQ